MPLTPALNAYKWSALGEAGSRTIASLVLLALARLLVPEDFGVVAAATVVISFSQVFVDAGLGKALVQRQGNTDNAANIVFWINLAIGVLVALLLFWIAPWVATFFHDPRITLVVRVLSVQIVLASLSSVHTALLQKSLDFRKLFWVRLWSSVVPALVSVPLAMSGFGYWALVAGTITTQIIQSTCLWVQSAWRPSLQLDLDLMRELLGFGKWALSSSLLAWGYGWIDTLVVGHYLGSHDMGLYRTGSTLAGMVFGFVFAPLLPVLYSIFSRSQHDPSKISSALPFVARAIALIALPSGFLLLAVANPLTTLVFGPQWQGLGLVIGIMGVVHSISSLISANGEAYRALGKPQIETWISFGLLLVYLVGYLAFIRFGFEAFLGARLGLVLIGVTTHILVARFILGIELRKWNVGKICAASLVAAAGVIAIDWAYLFSAYAIIGIACLVGAALVATLAVLERSLIRELMETLRKRSP